MIGYLYSVEAGRLFIFRVLYSARLGSNCLHKLFHVCLVYTLSLQLSPPSCSGVGGRMG